MLINETVVLLDSTGFFGNYVVVKILFIAVGIVYQVLCLIFYPTNTK